MPASRSTKLQPRRIRAALALAGKTPRSWAMEHGFGDQLKTVYAVLNGTRSGARSPEIVEALKGIRG